MCTVPPLNKPSPSTTLGIIKDKLDTVQMMVRHTEDSAPYLPDTMFAVHVDNIQKVMNMPVCSMATTCMFRKGKAYVYVLKLEDDCIYTGFTENLMERLHNHFTASGSAWTRLHPPVEVMHVLEGDKGVEREKTLEMMRVYGWEKVRGSTWCKVDMRNPPSELQSCRQAQANNATLSE